MTASLPTQSQLAFVFPGQGSQSLGMLGELAALDPVVQAAFAEASEGAGVDLWTLSQNGPEERLNQTEFTQPALLAAGVAAWRLWNERGGTRPAQLAGHSLGEYAALVAAGALSLEDGAHLVNTNHADILALAKRFDIGLIDRGAMVTHEVFVVDGKAV